MFFLFVRQVDSISKLQLLIPLPSPHISPTSSSPKIVDPRTGTTITTLPVITKCHIKADNSIDMIVAIRDRDNLIQADFAAGNDILEVLYQSGGEQECGITQSANALNYFNVRFRREFKIPYYS